MNFVNKVSNIFKKLLVSNKSNIIQNISLKVGDFN